MSENLATITLDDLEKEIKDGKIYLHHTAVRRGYVSLADKGWGYGNGILVEYSGRFGTGYIHKTKHYSSTRYCIYNYYIRKVEPPKKECLEDGNTEKRGYSL